MIKTNILPSKFKGNDSDSMVADIWTQKFEVAVKLSKYEVGDALELFKLWTNHNLDIGGLVEKAEEGIRNVDAVSLEELFEKTVDLLEIKNELPNHQEGSSKPETKENKSKVVLSDSKIDDLVKAMNKLALLSQTSRKSRDPSTYICYTCGLSGHTSKYCKEKAGFQSRDHMDKDAKSMLALGLESESSVSPVLSVEKIGSKRLRIDDLLNIPSEREKLTVSKESRRGNTNKTKNTKKNYKTKKSKKSLEEREIAKKLINSGGNFSLREIIDLRPSLVNGMIDYLIQVKQFPNRTWLVAEFHSEESIESLSYCVVSINEQEIPIFLDSGARYSIIDYSLMKRLGITQQKLNKPIKIVAINGEVTEVEYHVILPLRLDSQIIVDISFLVLHNFAVYILLGIDACQKMKANINYKREYISFSSGSKTAKLQLVSKEKLAQELEEISNSDSSSSRESYSKIDSENESESDDENSVHLMYAGMEASISECGIPDIGDIMITESDEGKTADSIGDSLDPNKKSQVRDLIAEYETIFATNHKDLKGIKDSSFKIVVNDESIPLYAKMRRYSQAENDIIDEEFILSTDASFFCIGAVLEQRGDDDILRPIAYFSRKLADAEIRYSAYEREALAVVMSIKNFICYLWGTDFIIYTDNSAVANMNNIQEPIGRISRWINFLSEFRFELKHRKGKDNGAADYLSRHIAGAFMEGEIVKTPYFNYLEDVKEFLTTGIGKSRFTQRQAKNFVVAKGKLYRRAKENRLLLVLMSYEELVYRLKAIHDQMGHFAVETIWNIVSEQYWRPKMYSEVSNYIKSCYSCQKFFLGRPSYKFGGQTSISGLFDTWYLDFLGPLPMSKNGNQYILVGVESLSKYPVAMPCNNQTSNTVIKYLSSMFAIFGEPNSLRTDQGTRFTSGTLSAFLREANLRIELNISHQPEWMGIVERANSTIRYSLAKTCNSDYSNWENALEQTLTGMRTRNSSVTGYSSHFLMFGVRSRVLSENELVLKPDEKVRKIELERLDGVRSSLDKPSISSKKIPQFKINELVLVLN
ncbi:Transposon Tf2-8 polyprotein [Smittium culicis]|uniref:Transposon Tf2-8 polyprotein n=1 Tax=Smittium culicis TaxID=133412 RepID=A0A1R1XJ94_9FUNG|nr:Transposon Tf2-8 polyprotein [Smittium culicis]